jgi:hypothetical protein
LCIDADQYWIEGEGSTIVDKPVYKEGRVWINKQQYFGGATEIAWNFYIGGYQSAQNWLKGRKTRELTYDDIRHYQCIIKILSETNRIMQTITMEL